MKNSWKPPAATSATASAGSATSTTTATPQQFAAASARVSASLPLEQYTFDSNNPYLVGPSSAQAALSSGAASSSRQVSVNELFEKGMQYYGEGHVDEAILAFEGAIQAHPEHAGNAAVSEQSNEPSTGVDEVWNMLGKCHAEMDKDAEAIFCHQQALEYDPFNLSALLALGTSHVNEMNSEQALECLQGWVKHNPKFHGLEARLKKQYNTDTADDVYAGDVV